MHQPPQKPQYITPEEIAARRAAQKLRRRANRRQIKAQTMAEVRQAWPYKVTLSAEPDRFEVRKWMIEQRMRAYDPELDNRERSDVSWNSNWREFRFAKEEHAMIFNLCFG